MLPRFRFVIAAVLLSGALFTFGIGAVALLHASHQQVASLPPRPPAPVFAQPVETVPATLALMRVETPETTESAPADRAAIMEQREPVTPAETAADTRQIAAVAPSGQPDSAEPMQAPMPDAEPDIAVPAPPQAAVEPAPAVTSMILQPPEPAQTQIAAVATPDPGAEPAKAPPAATETLASSPAASRIATLGGPAVSIETTTPAAKSIAVVKKKPAVAKRVVKKRRVVIRATPRALRPAVPASPFGASPFGT